MPIYQFINDKTGEIIDKVMTMNEPHVHEDQTGKWRRLFTVPCASDNTKIDAFSERDFVNKTAGKRNKFGDFWDLSKEMSEKRKEKTGTVDEVKKRYWSNWSKKRAGRPPPPGVLD